jgi:hypothetical protein
VTPDQIEPRDHTFEGRMRVARSFQSFGRDSKKALGTAASLRSRLAPPGFHASFVLQALQGGIDGSERDLTFRAPFDFLPHSYAIGSIFQPQERQYHDVFEFAEVLASQHILYKIEQMLCKFNLSFRRRGWVRIAAVWRAKMLRIVLLCLAVLIIVLFVPRLLSRSKPPATGSAAPDFTLSAQDGSLVSLKDYRGEWVVLYFYLKDQTPG